MFESGVSSYIVGTCTVEVCFPVDFKGNPHVCCAQCDLFSRSSNRCPITHAISEFPDKYVGSRCPLIFPPAGANAPGGPPPDEL